MDTHLLSKTRTLTVITAPRSGSDHLMVDGHDRDKQNRQEQKMSGVAPQLLQWEECCYHGVVLVEAPTESLVGSPV